MTIERDSASVDTSKPFDSLTHEELISLSDAEVNFYIDRECAEQGVPLLPPSPPVSPDIQIVPKTVAHYAVAGVRFLAESDARAVQAVINSAKSRRTLQYLGTYRWSDPQHDAPDTDEVQVTMDMVFDADGAARFKMETDQKADKKAAYDAAKKVYDQALTGRDNVAKGIRSTISSAWRLESRRQSLMSEYERYLPLANGDAVVAKRFLQRAHGDAREVLPDLFPEGWNDEPRAPEPQEEVML